MALLWRFLRAIGRYCAPLADIPVFIGPWPGWPADWCAPADPRQLDAGSPTPTPSGEARRPDEPRELDARPLTPSEEARWTELTERAR